jgi:hypothetical protein
MKVLSVLLVVLFSVIIISCDQQKANIPDNVKASFEEMFPGATEVEWEMENENEWEAEFEMDGKEASVCFTINGEWIETEYEIETLPETIETIINETYPGFEIDEVERVESPDFNGFEIELENGEEEIVILVTNDGVIQEVEIGKDDKEEEEE